MVYVAKDAFIKKENKYNDNVFFLLIWSVNVFLGLGIVFLVLILDQLSKWWVQAYISNTASKFTFGGFFNLVEAWNTGVSFSMFNNWGMLGTIVLSTVALLIVSFLIYWLYTEKIKIIQISLGFIIGGAIGNVIDRIRLGAVFDFLDFHINGHHWPAFNVADSFICIGATLIVIHGLFTLKNKKEEK